MRNATQLARLALRRLNRQRILSAAVPSSLVAAVVSALALLVARALGSPGLAVPVVAFTIGFAACLALLLRAAPLPSFAGAAAEIDERLRLEGRVASALALQGRTDAFALAAIEDGERAAALPGMSRRVREAFPMRWPSTAPWIPVALVGLSMLAWMVPARAPREATQVDAAGRAASPAEAQARAEQAEQRVQQAVQAIESSPEAQERLRDLLASVTAPQPPDVSQAGEGDSKSDSERREAEAAQRAAAIEERLSKELDLPEMKAIEALRDSLARLPEMPDAARELSQALKVGDLEGAMKQMESLAQQAAGSDPKSAEQARQALESMAAAIEKAAAQGSPELQQALKQAGLDPSLAKDPAAAMAAIEAAKQAGRVTPQQASSMQKQAQAQQQAQKQAKELAKAARDCKGGSCSSARSATSRAQAQQRMNVALKMAMSNCRNASSMGWSMPWQRGGQGGGSGQGSGGAGGGGGGGGTGGRKAGTGGSPKTDGQTKAIAEGTLPESQESAGEGDALDRAAARDFVRAQGVPVGVSSEQVRAVAAKVTRGLEEGTDEDPVPGRLKAAHKRYFDQWKRRLDATAPSGGAPAAAPKAAPPPASAPSTPAPAPATGGAKPAG